MNIDRLREEIEFGLQNLDEVYSSTLSRLNVVIDHLTTGSREQRGQNPLRNG